MTFTQAYKYAMEHSNEFKKHDEAVKKAMENKEQSACLVFSVDPGQTFYYGFDGLQVQKGRHTAKRSQYLIENERVLIIL